MKKKKFDCMALYPTAGAAAVALEPCVKHGEKPILVPSRIPLQKRPEASVAVERPASVSVRLVGF